MSSVIAPKTGAKCEDCGGDIFKPKVYDKKAKNSVYVCVSCGGYPHLVRLRRYLPIGIDGKSVRVEITENRIGEKLTSIHEAMHMARTIDYDLKDGRFDPNDYRTKGMAKDYQYKNVIRDRYLPYIENKFAKDELKRSSYDGKINAHKVLGKFFNELDIRKIKSQHIFEFFTNWSGGKRSIHTYVQELGVFLDYCKTIKLISIIPELPKTEQSRDREVEEFLNLEDQQKIIALVDDEFYRDAIQTLAIYAMRPCELRALKWKCIDFKNGSFAFTEHMSRTTMTKGRKSTLKTLTLPITEKFNSILSKLSRSFDGEGFVFTSKIGKGALGERRLNIHWNKANLIAKKKYKIKLVPLYVGTKHSTLTDFKGLGYSDEDLMLLTGHTQVKTFKRYGKQTEEIKIKKVRNILKKESIS